MGATNDEKAIYRSRGKSILLLGALVSSFGLPLLSFGSLGLVSFGSGLGLRLVFSRLIRFSLFSLRSGLGFVSSFTLCFGSRRISRSRLWCCRVSAQIKRLRSKIERGRSGC